MIAGDGHAYVPYGYRGRAVPTLSHLRLLWIDTAGAYDDIPIADITTMYSELFSIPVNMITNADTGILLSWSAWNGYNPVLGMAITNGTGVNLINASLVPDQSDMVVPVLQAQDGPFVGTVWAGSDDPILYMVAFDQTGSLRWSVPNEQPQIATEDGSVIAIDTDTGAAIIFNQSGNATGQMASLPIQSWTGNLYLYGSINQVNQVAGIPVLLATSFCAVSGGNESANSTDAQPLPDGLKAIYDGVGPDPFGAGTVLRSLNYQPYQEQPPFRRLKGVVIKEKLIYSYGQKPQSSNQTAVFEDQVGTRGQGDFGLTQQFLLGVPGYREYPVQIVPCTAPNTFGTPSWQNIIRATSQTVLVNQDPGSTNARVCR